MPSLESFPERLKIYRKTMGWTQEELAKQWSYSFETISAWERGKRKPNGEKIFRSITEKKSTYNLCFLDPNGIYCAEREREEGHVQGSLSALTHLNISNMETIRKSISSIDADSSKQLQIMTYDLPPRFNI